MAIDTLMPPQFLVLVFRLFSIAVAREAAARLYVELSTTFSHSTTTTHDTTTRQHRHGTTDIASVWRNLATCQSMSTSCVDMSNRANPTHACRDDNKDFRRSRIGPYGTGLSKRQSVIHCTCAHTVPKASTTTGPARLVRGPPACLTTVGHSVESESHPQHQEPVGAGGLRLRCDRHGARSSRTRRRGSFAPATPQVNATDTSNTVP
ncbi:hypothetical protein EK21DRAFT_88096 [Setomelanomma holmii]|uniref:Secreted protein n=1 Tax=Setomelanomma holmii TaxID=210430 RepID=A0A9P4HBV2_9PLEO|nr:hypothetical protein EK21DRAFT_88096 [Setomelanomma holmii]